MIALIEQEPRTALSSAAMCRALHVNRAAYYRARRQTTSRDDVELRDAIQRTALEMPGYGSRRITAELRRRSWTINRKRVQRLMREDNLLCLRRVKRVRTTDSRHGLTVYPNLVPELDLTGLNQLWVADITYVRLLREFVYLAVLLDAYARRCIGWSLGRTLEVELTLEALRMALAQRDVGPTLVHHSDRGVQYAAGDYTALLAEHGIAISMSRKASPNDNALAESFIKTLKYEEVYLFEYENFTEAQQRIEGFIERVYNEKRLHSALDYRPPNEYEQWLLDQQTPEGVAE